MPSYNVIFEMKSNVLIVDSEVPSVGDHVRYDSRVYLVDKVVHYISECPQVDSADLLKSEIAVNNRVIQAAGITA